MVARAEAASGARSTYSSMDDGGDEPRHGASSDPNVRRWQTRIEAATAKAGAVLSLLRSSGLTAEVTELLTTAEDLRSVLGLVMGLVSMGKAKPGTDELEVLEFATVRTQARGAGHDAGGWAGLCCLTPAGRCAVRHMTARCCAARAGLRPGSG